MAINDISRNVANLGFTGQFNYSKGDILFSGKNKPEILNKLPIGNDGNFLVVKKGLPAWGNANDILNAIAATALSLTLTNGKIYVGDASNVAQETELVAGPGAKIDYDEPGATVTLGVNQAYFLSRSSMRC
jgi:hypothetical protein